MKSKINFLVLVAALIGFVLPPAGMAFAQSLSIGVLDMQEVVRGSELGRKAQGEIEQRYAELQKTFQEEEEALATLQEEIEKKSSVWSEEKKQDKAIEFQKLRRDLRVKQDDANLELKQLQEKKLSPIFAQLEDVVKKFADEKGISVILPSQTVLYAVDSVDITEQVIKALNEQGKK